MEYTIHDPDKYPGIYRCTDNINNLKIRIRIVQELLEENVKGKRENSYVEKVFGWQEKCLSKEQKEYYRDEKNCYTDREIEYNRLLLDESGENVSDFLFSYCDDENYCPENEIHYNMTYLDCALNNLNIGGKTNVEDEYDFQKSIQKSYENPLIKHEWNTMYIMADFGEYFEDTWLKNEKVLCSLKFNEESKVLKVYPDFSNTRPYVLKIQSMEGKVFRYFIEHCSNLMPESIDSNQQTLIKKIREHSRNCVMNSLITETFRLPPKNKLFVFVFLEISAAKLFDYPDLFVEYSIHLPEGWSNCGEEALSGRTQLCRSSNNGGLVHFGHCVECFFEYNFINLENTEYSNKPYIYFEVLSKDSWDRYRTEGLCYTSLPISHSGMFHYNLKCFRFTTENPISEMRRFFIGDCHNYLDVSWVGVPDNLKENFLNKHDLSTTSTGELNVKMNIVHQSQEFLDENRLTGRKTKKIIFEQLSSSPLIKSVEQVIQEFKRARRELLEARKNV